MYSCTFAERRSWEIQSSLTSPIPNNFQQRTPTRATSHGTFTDNHQLGQFYHGQVLMPPALNLVQTLSLKLVCRRLGGCCSTGSSELENVQVKIVQGRKWGFVWGHYHCGYCGRRVFRSQ